MKSVKQQITQFSAATRKLLANRPLAAIASLLLLVMAAMAIVPLFIDFASIKEKIQTEVHNQTGGRINYQDMVLSLLPLPSLELRQVKLLVPDRLEARTASLRISPRIIPLLQGDLQLDSIELDSPQLSLQLTRTKAEKVSAPAQPSHALSISGLPEDLLTALQPLSPIIDGLKVRIDSGRLAIFSLQQKLVNIEDLDLLLDLSVSGADSARAGLSARISTLDLYRRDHRETAKDLSLEGSLQLAGDGLQINIDRFLFTEPKITLTGKAGISSSPQGLSLELSGSDIDVDATRKAVLSLAGDTDPVIREIFAYLCGGRAVQISFASHGKTLPELGELNNMLIEGRLEEGKISIPPIKLDLTEVAGDVVIDKGVLHGSGLNARLNNSTGKEGSLIIGLTEEKNQFQLELTLDADLAEAKPILQRLVEVPAFTSELKKIDNLHGSGHGRLTLGDSLDNLSVSVEMDQVNLSAEHRKVPLPIGITLGRLVYRDNIVNLEKLAGSLGQSKFTDLSCRFLLEKEPSLDFDSGPVDLDITELSPWLISPQLLGEQLPQLKRAAGRIHLSSLKLQGPIGRPSKWLFEAKGSPQDLRLDTPMFPATVSLAGGEFSLDNKQLSFKKVQAAGQDAQLVASGSLTGLSLSPQQIDLLLDGRLGPKTTDWLFKTLEVPEFYAIRGPLDISRGRLFLQPEQTIAFNGQVAVDRGPKIIADVEYGPDRLQLHRLGIKDQYSDAELVFDRNSIERKLKFTGRLQHETLQAVFINNRFSSGGLKGDFTVSIPQTGSAAATAAGLLTGENLPLLLTSGDNVYIDRINLQADGPKVKTAISRLTWRNLVWEPVEGTIFFNRDRAHIQLDNAKLCGIDTFGTFSSSGTEYAFNMALMGKGLDVTKSYSCLTEGRVKATGSLDFSSTLRGKGTLDELLQGMQGPLRMTFSNGVIEQDKLVARTLEVLNVSEIVKGRLPDLDSTGLSYSTMTLTGNFAEGKLAIDSFHMNGDTLELVGYGTIDLDQETIDAQLLAAPFKTVDSIIKYIPGVNYLLGGSLVTIPMSIDGSLDDPKVAILSASAVGSSLYNLAERTITSPFRLIEKIMPKTKSKENFEPVQVENGR